MIRVPELNPYAIVGAAVSAAIFLCLLAEPFFEWWFRWKNRRENERWLRSNANYFDGMDDELEELLNG